MITQKKKRMSSTVQCMVSAARLRRTPLRNPLATQPVHCREFLQPGEMGASLNHWDIVGDMMVNQECGYEPNNTQTTQGCWLKLHMDL